MTTTPPSTTTDKLAAARKLMREAALLGSATSVLHWDEQTQLPPKGGSHRADQVSLLARLVHERATDQRLGELLAEVNADLASLPNGVEGAPAAEAREALRGFSRSAKLPSALVEELARVGVLGQQAWVEARKNNDFPAFAPWLSQMLDLKRQEAACVAADGGPGSPESGPGAELYDALLDEYEPGETAFQLTRLFGELRPALVGIVESIAGSGRQPNREILERHYPVAEQEALARHAAAAIGFDFDAGRLDRSVHPFCTGLGPGDTRLTTRYDEHDFRDAFFGVLHETGHGLYDQGLPAEHFGSPLGSDAGLGVHESQSRLWENLVGRSRSFWTYFLPKARAAFPAALQGVSDDDWMWAINDARPSLIRTESDEVTYNLHVLLRFEIERALLSGDLPVADLPEAWNAKLKELLGVEAPDDARGCLQDIHWSGGALGYFPTYTLGNLYAAQLFEAAGRDLGDLAAQFSKGEFAPLLGWLREKVHCHGRRYPPRELIRRATGSEPTAAPLLRHLRAKASEYYGA